MKRTHLEKGITMIALVVTIVILLILSSIGISMLVGENAIINKAINAKEQNEIEKEKEILEVAVISVSQKHRLGYVVENDLKEELNKAIGEGKYSLKDEFGGILRVKYDSGRSYIIYSNTGEIVSVQEIANLKGKKMDAKTIAIDSKGDILAIPEGFMIFKDSPLNVVEGIIVEDCTGNQYVWVPVMVKNEERTWGIDYSEVKSEKDYTKIEEALKRYTSSYSRTGYSDRWHGDAETSAYGYYDGTKFNYYSNGNMPKEEYNTLYNNFLTSVYKHRGFFIARYEMGISIAESAIDAQSKTRTGVTEYTVSTSSSGSTNIIEDGAPSIQGMATPISKENAVVYTHVTQSQLQMLAEKLAQENNYGSTICSLIFGVQWDATCVFIEKCDKRNNATTESDWLKNNSYSKSWGNYNKSLFKMDRGYYTTAYDETEIVYNDKKEKTEVGGWLYTAGASDQNSSLNIYELGGNMWEWTLECGSSKHSAGAIRGGSGTNNYSPSQRNGDVIYAEYSNVSGRIALYVQ